MGEAGWVGIGGWVDCWVEMGVISDLVDRANAEPKHECPTDRVFGGVVREGARLRLVWRSWGCSFGAYV